MSAATARPTGDLHDARDAHTATRLPNGTVLVTGGFGREGTPPLRTAETWSVDTGRWSSTGSLDTPRGGHAAAALGDDSVLVAGGWVAPRRYTDTTEIYDASTRKFRDGPKLPVAVDGLAATALVDGQVLLTGGQSSPGVASAMAVLVSPDGTIHDVGPMAQPRFKHASLTLPDGRVLVVGGTPDDTNLLTSTEVFDPTTRRFSPGPDLGSGRYKLAGSSAVTDDGRVVVAGGGPGAEVVDLEAGTSTALDAVPPVRLSFSTVSIVGDQVRIVGGYDERIRLTHTDIVTTVPPRRT